jgi:hypothetical protein
MKIAHSVRDFHGSFWCPRTVVLLESTRWVFSADHRARQGIPELGSNWLIARMAAYGQRDLIVV